MVLEHSPGRQDVEYLLEIKMKINENEMKQNGTRTLSWQAGC